MSPTRTKTELGSELTKALDDLITAAHDLEFHKPSYEARGIVAEIRWLLENESLGDRTKPYSAPEFAKLEDIPELKEKAKALWDLFAGNHGKTAKQLHREMQS